MSYQISSPSPSKMYMCLDTNSDALVDVPKRVNQRTNAEAFYPRFHLMACNREIPSAYYTLKNIHLGSDLYKVFASPFYYDKVSPLGLFSG